MKGLLVKDIKIILQNKKFFLIMLILALVMFTQGKSDNYSFIAGYTTMIFILIPINTLAYDENDKSITFLLTLPIKRDTYVTEKYIISFTFSFLSSILTTLFCAVMQPQHVTEILVMTIPVYAIMSLFIIIMIPVRLKFGTEKSTIALIIFAVFIFAVLGGLKKFADIINAGNAQLLPGIKNFVMNAANAFSSLNKWFIIAALCLLWLICLMVSFLISLRCMRRKEF